MQVKNIFNRTGKTIIGVCRAVCGGFKCIKPGEKNKNEKSQKCGAGDTFMQCVYQKIDTKVDCNKIKIMREKNIYFRFVLMAELEC